MGLARFILDGVMHKVVIFPSGSIQLCTYMQEAINLVIMLVCVRFCCQRPDTIDSAELSVI